MGFLSGSLKSGCGANAKGGGGFQQGNTCASDSGSSSISTPGKTGKSSVAKQTESKEFKAWFGDSKVVNEQGEPLMVYHGGKFGMGGEKEFVNRNSPPILVADEGFFFTQDAEMANWYADDDSVTPVYLRLENPKVFGEGENIMDASRERLKALGHDGWISQGGKELVVFDPTQIKSAVGNSGSFDRSNPDITKSFRKPFNADTTAKLKSVRNEIASLSGWCAGTYMATKDETERLVLFTAMDELDEMEADITALIDGVESSKRKSGSGCGANAKGGGGFQPGNTCGGEVATSTASTPITFDEDELSDYLGIDEGQAMEMLSKGDKSNHWKVAFESLDSDQYNELFELDSIRPILEGNGFAPVSMDSQIARDNDSEQDTGNDISDYIDATGIAEDYSKDVSFRGLNKKLRSGDSLPDKWVPLADAASNPIRNQKLFRGVDEETMRKYQVGNIITEHGFSSTSQLIGVASGFGDGGIIEIDAKTGVSMQSISERDEYEVIQAPGRRYKVVGKSIWQGQTVVNAKEIDTDNYDAKTKSISSGFLGGKTKSGTNCGANATGGHGFQPGNTCASGGGASNAKLSNGMQSAKLDGKKQVLANGKPVPEHVPHWPPAWTDVQVATSKNAKVLVKGRDAKGRPQSIYSESHQALQAQKKFAKIRELRSKMADIAAEIAADRKAGSEPATVLELIRSTGLRPGSTRDTKSEKQAYGATTLLAKHVTTDSDGGVVLDFTGKKGVHLSIPIRDKSLADSLKARASKYKPNERIFSVSDDDLRDYTRQKDGGKFTPKDFRTAIGTTTALKSMESMAVPTSESVYKSSVKQVATIVSKQLGNTSSVALQSYIDPTIFTTWRAGAGL